MRFLSKIKFVGFFTSLLLLPILTFADGPVGGGTPGLPNPLVGGVDSLHALLKIILTNIVLPIGSIVVVLMIIYSGFLFVTARGSEDKIEKAKHVLTYVVIGTAILFGSVVISSVIGNTLCQIAPTLPNCSQLGNPLGN